MRRRPRVIATLVLVVVTVAASFTALALGTGTGSVTTPGTPVAAVVPTDPGTGIAGLMVPAGVQATAGAVVSGGVSRSYLLVQGASVARSTPLVVGLHGRNATPALEVTRDELLPRVASGAAVLVYPTGWDRAWNVDDGSCCGDAVAAGFDDVAFVAAVVEQVRTQLQLTGPTDLVGYSNGGRFAFDIACRDPGRYAAVVTVSAAPDWTCDTPPVPLLAVANADDTELPTHEHPRAAAVVLAGVGATWARRDACGSPAAPVVTAAATVTRWTTCAAGSSVETVLYDVGAGHGWPSAAQTGDGGAAARTWAFLATTP